MRLLPFLFLLVLLSAGCGSSTYVTNSWKSPNTSTLAFKRIAVLALTSDEGGGRDVRQQIEGNLAAALVEKGYNAYSTYAQYGPQRFERNSEEAAINKLKSSNADAVFTVALLDRSQERDYVPGRVSYAPIGGYYNRFWGYYTTVYDRMYTPGYYTTNTRYFWEANLYDLNTGSDDALIYTAQSESFDPASAESLGRAYAQSLIRDLDKAGLLRNKK